MKLTNQQLKQIIKEELSNISEEEITEGRLEDVSLASFLAMGVALGAWTIAELTRPEEHPTLQQWAGDIDENVLFDVEQQMQSPESVK